MTAHHPTSRPNPSCVGPSGAPGSPAPGRSNGRPAGQPIVGGEHHLACDTTTIEQIAEAAEVSPSTFFRYFPTKEAVALADDLDPYMLRAFAEVPAGVPPIAAIKAGLVAALDRIGREALDFERERQKIVLSEPELRAVMLDEFTRNVTMLATAVAEREGADPNGFEARVFAGAVVGALYAGLSPHSKTDHDYAEALVALDLLEQGLPLSPRNSPTTGLGAIARPEPKQSGMEPKQLGIEPKQPDPGSRTMAG